MIAVAHEEMKMLDAVKRCASPVDFSPMIKVLDEATAALKESNDKYKRDQSDTDYEELQRMIKRHGVCNVVSLLSQACGNLNPLDGSVSSESYYTAEEVLSNAAAKCDLQYKMKEE